MFVMDKVMNNNYFTVISNTNIIWTFRGYDRIFYFVSLNYLLTSVVLKLVHSSDFLKNPWGYNFLSSVFVNLITLFLCISCGFVEGACRIFLAEVLKF